MKRMTSTRRMMILAGASAILAGCQIVPKTGPAPVQRPAPAPTPEPSATALPTDQTRHRIALLVPLSGSNAAVGQSIANASTMALLDTNADNLRITTYDTATGAQSAAARAIRDGNKLILGPLMGDNAATVQAEARAANVPLISFSNDTTIAGPNVFVMGHIPEQSIARSVAFARSKGANRFAAIVPEGDYGSRAEAGLVAATRQHGGTVAALERYTRGNTSIVGAAQRVEARGPFDAVLIADSPTLATRAAEQLRPGGRGSTQIVGTELWSGESAVTRSSAMRGAIFSAVSDGRYKRFSDSYTSRFGNAPYRISTLGYDAVLLTLNVAQDWRVGQDFPVRRLRDQGGFLGLDGAFRFQRNGVVERAMEVRRVENGRVVVEEGAPRSFGG